MLPFTTGNIAPNEPSIAATYDAPSENDIAESNVLYPVAVPPKCIVCVPAVPHVHVYLVFDVPVRLIILLEMVLPVVVPDWLNVPPSPQST